MRRMNTRTGDRSETRTDRGTTRRRFRRMGVAALVAILAACLLVVEQRGGIVDLVPAPSETEDGTAPTAGEQAGDEATSDDEGDTEVAGQDSEGGDAGTAQETGGAADADEGQDDASGQQALVVASGSERLQGVGASAGSALAAARTFLASQGIDPASVQVEVPVDPTTTDAGDTALCLLVPSVGRVIALQGSPAAGWQAWWMGTDEAAALGIDVASLSAAAQQAHAREDVSLADQEGLAALLPEGADSISAQWQAWLDAEGQGRSADEAYVRAGSVTTNEDGHVTCQVVMPVYFDGGETDQPYTATFADGAWSFYEG